MVAVGEERGRRIYVFEPDGLAYSVIFDSPVLTFSVNQPGYLAVVLQMDKGYAVQIFNKRYGTEPLYQNFISDPGVVPTSVSVSEKGNYVAIALLDYEMRLSSRVMFSYINAQDARFTNDATFATFYYDGGQIVQTTRFMADDQALVVTDSQIICYRPGDNRSLAEQWRIPLHNRISHLSFYGGSRFAYAAGDKFLNDGEAAEPGEIHIYAMDGERTGSFRLGRKATYLNMGHNHVIVGGNRHFYILNHRGEIIWDHQTLFDTRDFIFLDNTNTVLAAGGARANILKRVKARVEENE
jgi:hypothetical protein